MNWRWISIAALLAVVVIGVGILTNRSPVESAIGNMPEQPAYYLKDAIITETAEDGTPNLRLVANRIEQQPADNSFVLHSVRVDYLRVPDKRWFLSAQRGLVPGNSRRIQFDGNVELRPIDGPASMLLAAEEITIDSDRNVAYTTSSPVNIHFGNFAITAGHFEADLTTEKVTMKSVQGHSDAG